MTGGPSDVMPKVKYPGGLGVPILSSRYLAAALKHRGNEDALNEWLFSERFKAMPLLLDYYGIRREDKNCWFFLAWELALHHVPACSVSESRPRGRPRKLVSLSDYCLSQKGRPGRKKKHTDESEQQFIQAVKRGCAERGYDGHGAVTRLFKEVLTEMALKRGESVSRTLKVELPYLRRRYSEAKSKFPDLAI